MSKFSNRTIIWLAILVFGIGLIAFSSFTRDARAPEPTVSVSTLPQLTNSPLSQLTTSSTPKKSTSNNKIVACQLSGSIHFINDNLYETKGAKIAYQNIDDVIRQIYWTSNPNDGVLTVGPNIFEGLQIPDGEKSVGVSLNRKTSVKLYTLTAAVTYGVKLPQGGEEEKIANCTGSVTVTLP